MSRALISFEALVNQDPSILRLKHGEFTYTSKKKKGAEPSSIDLTDVYAVKPSEFSDSLVTVYTCSIGSVSGGCCAGPKDDRVFKSYKVAFSESSPCTRFVEELNTQLYGSPSPPLTHLFVVCNPFSGVKKASTVFHEEVEPIFNRAGATFDYVETTGRGHAAELTQSLDLSAYDGIITVGGDGVFYEAINGMMSRPDWRRAMATPFGIIPAGTGNGLALGLGYESPAVGAAVAVKGATMRMDLMGVWQGGRRWVGAHSLMWAFVSDVDLESENMRSLGDIRYTLHAISKAFGLRNYQGRMRYLEPARKRPREEWDKCTVRQCEWCKSAETWETGPALRRGGRLDPDLAAAAAEGKLGKRAKGKKAREESSESSYYDYSDIEQQEEVEGGLVVGAGVSVGAGVGAGVGGGECALSPVTTNGLRGRVRGSRGSGRASTSVVSSGCLCRRRMTSVADSGCDDESLCASDGWVASTTALARHECGGGCAGRRVDSYAVASSCSSDCGSDSGDCWLEEQQETSTSDNDDSSSSSSNGGGVGAGVGAPSSGGGGKKSKGSSRKALTGEDPPVSAKAQANRDTYVYEPVGGNPPDLKCCCPCCCCCGEAHLGEVEHFDNLATSAIPSLFDSIPIDDPAWKTIDLEVFPFFVLSNTPFLGATALPHPHAHVGDGTLDMSYMPHATTATILGAITEFEKGTHIDLEGLEYVKVAALELVVGLRKGDYQGLLNIDGEAIDYEAIRVEVYPKLATMFAPTVHLPLF